MCILLVWVVGVGVLIDRDHGGGMCILLVWVVGVGVSAIMVEG